MNKLSYIIVFLFLFPLLPSAQTVSVSEDMNLRNDLSYEIIGEMKNQFLLFRDKNTEFQVHAFNSSMKKQWEKELELDKRQPKVLGVFANQNNFTLIYRFRKKGHTILKAHKYDPGANLIDSVTIKDFGYLFYTPNFQIVRADDRSKLLIYFIERQAVVNATVYDLVNMKFLWDKTFEPDKFIYGRDFRQMLVDNEGNFRMIVEKDNLRSKKEEHRYEVHEYVGERDKLSFYTISMRGKLTFDIIFEFDNLNKNLLAAGLYATKNIAKAQGYFFMTLDPRAPDDHLLVFTPFDDEFVSNVEGKVVEDNKGITETIIQEIVLRRDGGILMIAERSRELERRSVASSRVYYDNTSRFIIDHHYDELFVISIHPDGKTHWKTILHKKQYSQDDDGIYSSYFLVKTSSNLRFLFNDEIKYENTVSEYVINGNGDYDRNSLLSTEDRQLRLRFRDALQVDANVIIIPSERRNRLRLVRLEY